MRSLHTFLLISDAIVHSYYDRVTTVTGFAHPEGSMHQFCRQHLEVHRNAEIKLVCSESYYDRLLRYAADQWSTLQRVAPCLTLQNVCSGTYGELGLNACTKDTAAPDHCLCCDHVILLQTHHRPGEERYNYTRTEFRCDTLSIIQHALA